MDAKKYRNFLFEDALGSILDGFGRLLGASGGPLGACWAPLGRFLGASWALLGASWVLPWISPPLRQGRVVQRVCPKLVLAMLRCDVY